MTASRIALFALAMAAFGQEVGLAPPTNTAPCIMPAGWDGGYPLPLVIPRLEKPPVIDGNLSEWKYFGFSDGMWDIFRVMHSPWYDPRINRLTDVGNEPPPEEDLSSRYYTAWDDKYLYFGAEVHDNVNDVDNPAALPQQWYYRDAVCWFIEAPRHGKSQKFGRGDNGFCFVADSCKPWYGAWWRHGNTEKTYIEEPLPKSSVDYVIRMDPWKTGKGDFILEARVEMSSTLGRSDPDRHPPKIGDEYGLEIVHTDPDGGGYGGHIIMYGNGDDDATWGTIRLVGPIQPVERRRD